MNENRKQILQMLSLGQITAEEAESLIAAIEKEPAADALPKVKAKVLRVMVEDGPTKVNVRVPMQLLRAGVKLTSLIPPQARIKLDSAMRENGMMIDLSQLKPENLEELIDQLNDLTVDVDDKNAKVRVFAE
jgi:hypothetical protein